MDKRRFEMDEMVRYCNQYGFIFQGSEIYGGLANTWDYGPLGTRLKSNIKDAWRYFFIQNRDNSFELDSDILMNPTVWEASGHVAGFSDPLLDCKECRTRHRADNLINEFDSNADADEVSKQEMMNYINEYQVPCPVLENLILRILGSLISCLLLKEEQQRIMSVLSILGQRMLKESM